MSKIDFLGKGDVAGHHLAVSFHQLETDKKKSVGNADDDNLIIQGDNLLALKALLPRYAGRVKCIYIDPPYNTGNEGWCYSDKVNSPLMKDWLDKTVDKEDQSRHDKWLCMMYPRLQLLKELLSDDGVIFISIDDNEQHRLRSIMDEVFGEENFFGIFAVKTPNQTEDKNRLRNLDFLVAYSKQSDGFSFNVDSKIQTARCTTGKENQTQPEIEFPAGIEVIDVNDGVYNQPKQTGGKEDVRVVKGKIVVKDGLLDESVILVARWSNPNDIKAMIKKYSSESKEPVFNKFRKELIKLWLKGERFQPQMDKIGGDLPDSFWGDFTDKGSGILKQIIPNISFDYPKHPNLIKYIINLSTNKDSIILDSFAGSGTTAHATLALNKEDGGNRKFILVECEDYADEITAERIRRVIQGVPTATDENIKKGLGGTFTYATLGKEITPEKLLTGESMPDWETLASHVFWLATGVTLEKVPKANKEWLVGVHKNKKIYLLYQPDVSFMRSNQAVLTGDIADKLGESCKNKNEQIICYAAAAYVSQREMSVRGIVFCQLPWTITRAI